jgi:hypothetical protein
MVAVAIACMLLLVLTTVVHYEALRGLHLLLAHLPVPQRAKVVALIIGAFAAHATEIGLYALAMYVLFRWLGAAAPGATHMPFSTLFYFSAETYTSLGYGDIVPHGPLRLLAGSEALNGLLAIGWSTAQVFKLAMEAPA